MTAALSVEASFRRTPFTFSTFSGVDGWPFTARGDAGCGSEEVLVGEASAMAGLLGVETDGEERLERLD